MKLRPLLLAGIASAALITVVNVHADPASQVVNTSSPSPTPTVQPVTNSPESPQTPGVTEAESIGTDEPQADPTDSPSPTPTPTATPEPSPTVVSKTTCGVVVTNGWQLYDTYTMSDGSTKVGTNAAGTGAFHGTVCPNNEPPQ